MNLSKFLCLTLLSLTVTARAVPVTVQGLDNNGEIGTYNIGGQNYWWMCIEPGTPELTATISAEMISFIEGWDQQNTQRLTMYQGIPGYETTILPKQVAVMSYVLDAYLPWSTMAGTSGRFIEQDSNAGNFGNDHLFYNSMMVVQNFLAETYGKAVKTDFTTMTDYDNYFDGAAVGDPDALAARSLLFQQILDDIEAKDGTNFFDTYTAQHGYMVINTLFGENAPENWQDGLIIYSLAPVPEPGGALLIASCGMVWLLRRRRLRHHS